MFEKLFSTIQCRFTKTKDLLDSADVARKKEDFDLLASCGQELFRRYKNDGGWALIDISVSVANIGSALFSVSSHRKSGEKLLNNMVQCARDRSWTDAEIQEYLLKDVPDFPLPLRKEFEIESLQF